jgi:hypothetical protein
MGHVQRVLGMTIARDAECSRLDSAVFEPAKCGQILVTMLAMNSPGTNHRAFSRIIQRPVEPILVPRTHRIISPFNIIRDGRSHSEQIKDDELAASPLASEAHAPADSRHRKSRRALRFED